MVTTNTEEPQACVLHLIRATLRYASRKYWDQLVKDLRAIYTAPSTEAAWAAFEELKEKWGKPYPAIPKLWRAAWRVPRSAWAEFTPFLAYDIEIRRVLWSTSLLSPSTPGTGVPSGREGSSPPSRPPSKASTWSPEDRTQRHRARTMDLPSPQ